MCREGSPVETRYTLPVSPVSLLDFIRHVHRACPASFAETVSNPDGPHDLSVVHTQWWLEWS